MEIRVRFLGGAGSVTGSKFLLMVDEFNILIDCGLFQGLKELRLRNREELPIAPEAIDAVLLTHAHIDHSGYIPVLCKSGFKGKIHCTEPTLALAELLLKDSGKLQEEEADFANKKGYSKHNPAKALYTMEDATNSLNYFKTHPFSRVVTLRDDIEICFYHAGHILGAASIEVRVQTSQGVKTLLFSGDIGPVDSPLHVAPAPPATADILFMESTYGDRNQPHTNIENELRGILNTSDEKGGMVLIPAFSVGRTQLIVYHLWRLFQSLPSRPVYIDSPMAISATDLYKEYQDFHRLQSSSDMIHQIFDAPFLHYVTEQGKSKNLNNLKKGGIIISASGMATGGRILHHLYHRLRNEQDIVLFTGFLPEGTRGRSIVDGEKRVKIFGEDVPVHAQIEKIDGFSAHADQDGLLHWADHIKGSPKRTFIVHGEASAATVLKSKLEERNWNVTIPDYLEVHSLFDHI